ncbi:Tol-Pal system beta propeller repeat protein TolB [bacterium endosymbiont of Pedicinus badii]|uniref:Tol-Pal system beta propeller repeat protein TolB n=1 Tax=bacterium endosymbiont of Pedicinus badii TaxID=1719126 RepID=UPI0018A87113|nr:Tol-Pal system beta propeller repeat protein TolB [bacterium endosymbiont of Pedicinus badii]
MNFLQNKCKNYKFFFTTILFFLFFDSYSSTLIKIEEGEKFIYPIEIVHFSYEESKKDSQYGKEICQIIYEDFLNSSRFIPKVSGEFNTEKYLNNLNKTENLNSILVLTGSVHENYDENITIFYQLTNLINKKKETILANQIKMNKKMIRKIAHTISNEIFQEITSKKGIFCNQIAYVMQMKYKDKYFYSLKICDYDGYNKSEVFKSEYPIMSPSWSPDGKKIAYSIFSENGSKIVVQDLSNGSIEIVSNFTRHNGSPSWSPDGKKIACSLSKDGNLNIYVIELQEKKITQITNNRNTNTEPKWFPDSERLVYTSDQGGKPQIYSISIRNKKSKRISWNEYIQNQNAEVSKDGKFIVLVSKNKNLQSITKINLETESIVQITENSLNESPSIAPNNSVAICSSLFSNHPFYLVQIFSLEENFKKILFLEENGMIKFPVWSPFIDE